MNKNLKKVISTVAALAMSASAVSAFAVNFPDVPEDASYAQAVQELSALKVISGFEDGTFRPDELVTRAQITKMIVDALAETESAESSKAKSQFTDVNDHWAQGYINQGVADAFIAGYGDGTFGPDDNVTYVQAQKMLVSAIGYETYAQGSGGWPNGYKTWAASQGITDGISGIADDTQLTRAQVAQLVDNAMGAPICVIKDYDTTWDGRKVPNLEIKDDEGKNYQTLFTKKHDAYKVYGRVVDTTKTDPSLDTDKVEFRVEKADNFNDEYIKAGSVGLDEAGEPMYYGDTNAVELLETYAQALIQKNSNDEYTILSISAASAAKVVTLAAEDLDENKTKDQLLYFYPAGTTRNSTKYEIANDADLTVYVNGTKQNMTYADVVTYIKAHDTASVTLQKTTESGKTSTNSKYNLINITDYATAVVTDVNVKSNSVVINFDTNSINKSSMTVYLDDDSYTYDFTFEGAAIDPADLQEDDVLSIAYEPNNFSGSKFYDVIVSRDTAEGKLTSVSTATPYEYTFDSTTVYKAAETDNQGKDYLGISATNDAGNEYTLYLDHFGRIAKVDEREGSKNYGILKNIYKKTGGDWYAQIITNTGAEEEYKVDDKNVAAYGAYLKVADEAAAGDKTASKAFNIKDTNGVTYNNNNNTKLIRYPQQVVEYTVASSSNKITIKGAANGTNGADQEYKESGNKIGSIKLGTSSIILDISEADDDEIKTVSTLVDGNKYDVVGYDKTNTSDKYYRFVLITKGTSNFNSETQLAVFNGSEVVSTDDGDKTAYKLIVNGAEDSYVLKDSDVEVHGIAEGDPVLFTTNAAGEVSKIQPIFLTQSYMNGKSYDDFAVAEIAKLTGNTDSAAMLAKVSGKANWANANSWNKFLDGKSDDMDIVYGVVVNKSGSTINIATDLKNSINVKDNTGAVTAKPGVWAVYDDLKDLDVSGATVYTYNFGYGNKNSSKVFTDDSLLGTPDRSSAKETDENGKDCLNVANGSGVLNVTQGANTVLEKDATRDVVFAVARVDNDEVKEIYQIVYSD